ncbi:hypothetical protein B0H14DRAFT_2613826 [Mycena olivaceomarginata]|nr:hypothetical protein B0H14DRAFT_2613826 [Mycena olivaceomarginata]
MSMMILDSMEGNRAGSDLPPNSVVAPEPVKGGTTGGGGCGVANAPIAASVSGVSKASGVGVGGFAGGFDSGNHQNYGNWWNTLELGWATQSPTGFGASTCQRHLWLPPRHHPVTPVMLATAKNIAFSCASTTVTFVTPSNSITKPLNSIPATKWSLNLLRILEFSWDSVCLVPCFAAGVAANGGILLYSKNSCSGGRQRGPTEPAAHIRRRTGCGNEVCEAYENATGFCVHGWFDFSDRGKDVWNEHTVVGGKGLSSGQGGRKVENTSVVVGRDLSASAGDVTMSTVLATLGEASMMPGGKSIATN